MGAVALDSQGPCFEPTQRRVFMKVLPSGLTTKKHLDSQFDINIDCSRNQRPRFLIVPASLSISEPFNGGLIFIPLDCGSSKSVHENSCRWTYSIFLSIVFDDIFADLCELDVI